MKKSLYFKEEHELFRQSLQDFFKKEILPHTNQWEENRQIPKNIWEKMGEMGYLGIYHEEKYGGLDLDFWYTVVFLEELAKTNAGFSGNISVHMYMATNHIAKAGNEALKQKYLPDAIAGKKIAALAISEPNAGSDVAALRTNARREGDNFIINGQKLWITNGTYCDFYCTAVKTEKGLSLIVIDAESEGVSRRKLNKMGLHSSDTAEVFFDNVKVPVSNLVGEEGKGFAYIMDSFQLERLTIGIGLIGGNEWILAETLEYMAQRETFGRAINKYQVLRHNIAQLAAEIEQNKQFIYHTCWLLSQGEYVVKECSMIKLLSTELNKKVIDECLQMFGGYGYSEDFVVCQAYRDTRVGTIAGGTSQIMREIIAKMVVDNTVYQKAYSETDTITEKPIKIAKEIILSLPERFKPEKALDYQTIIHYDIAGVNGGKYTIKIQDGVCEVKDNHEGQAKCVITVEDSIYEGLELGKINPQEALINGKINISDLGEMMKFTKVFKRL
ncbi:MAG: acyl-CoA dehydrogenase [Cytophagia bacterium]|nr:MAG: acyl-CoA dehydrogenase [Cytophagia bacterium]